MVVNQEWEFKPRDEIIELQVKRLRNTLSHVAENVPFYGRQLGDAGVSAKDIASLDDLARLPFTVKQDLRDHYPFDLFAVPV